LFGRAEQNHEEPVKIAGGFRSGYHETQMSRSLNLISMFRKRVSISYGTGMNSVVLLKPSKLMYSFMYILQ
jgi:hypothetical protein